MALAKMEHKNCIRAVAQTVTAHQWTTWVDIRRRHGRVDYAVLYATHTTACSTYAVLYAAGPGGRVGATVVIARMRSYVFYASYAVFVVTGRPAGAGRPQ